MVKIKTPQQYLMMDQEKTDFLQNKREAIIGIRKNKNLYL